MLLREDTAGVLLDADVAASRMALEVLDAALAGADLAHGGARRLVALLESDGFEELPHPEGAGVARGASRREDVVRSDRLVAVRHGRRFTEEERAVVPHPLEIPPRFRGLDLDMLERILLCDVERLLVGRDDDHLAVVVPCAYCDLRGR